MDSSSKEGGGKKKITEVKTFPIPFALEEIKANAGRFFICPMSHKIDLGKHNKLNNIAENHDKYIEQVVSIIKSNKIKLDEIAPWLK